MEENWCIQCVMVFGNKTFKWSSILLAKIPQLESPLKSKQTRIFCFLYKNWINKNERGFAPRLQVVLLAIFCYNLLYFAILCNTLLYLAILGYTWLYFAILCYTLLHFAIFCYDCYILLYFTIFCYILL